MGHERLGLLPRSKKWTAISDELGRGVVDRTSSTEIARHVLANVSGQFSRSDVATGLPAAFRFLLTLAVAARTEDVGQFLKAKAVLLEADSSVSRVVAAAKTWVNEQAGVSERSSLTSAALCDTIAQWYVRNAPRREQAVFFPRGEIAEIWRGATSGSGFCELAKVFFANYAEKHIRYFLDREASSRIPDLRTRELFNENVRRFSRTISDHSLESAEIVKSLSAGWFNKESKTGIPDSTAVHRFLRFALAKIRSEIEREVPTI